MTATSDQKMRLKIDCQQSDYGILCPLEYILML